MNRLRRPILVTWAHRSGTTWVGKMLCAGGDACYIHEPFNVSLRIPRWVPVSLPYWYYHVPERNALPPRFLHHLENALQLRFPLRANLRHLRSPGDVRVFLREALRAGFCRWRRARPLLKDPLAVFSVAWLARTYDMEVVVMIRHPAAFAASLKLRGWDFDFRHWREQPRLMATYLRPFTEEIETFVREKRSIVEQAALLWKGIYTTVLEYQKRHPDWIFLRHEDLLEDPVGGFQALYRRLGLRWNRRVVREIRAHMRASAGSEADPFSLRRDPATLRSRWKKVLTREEIAYLRRETRELAAHFYEEQDWGLIIKG